jgi:rhodanese-related sulfurtransferase
VEISLLQFLQKDHNGLLAAAAVVSGAMLLWPLLRRGAAGRTVNTLEATQMMNRSDALVIDLRATDEFAQGHVLGARNIPIADLERRAADLEKHKAKPVIVYSTDANRASTAVAALRKAGFASVHNLAGGYAAWQQAGLPVEKK